MITTESYETIQEDIRFSLIHASSKDLDEAEDTLRHALFFNRHLLTRTDILQRRTILSFIEEVKAVPVKERNIRNQYNKFLSPKPFLNLPRPSSKSKPRYAQTLLKPHDVNRRKRLY